MRNYDYNIFRFPNSRPFKYPDLPSSLLQLDLFAFSGYKYVLLVITTCVRIYLGKTLSWLSLLYTMGAVAFFIVNTLNPVFKPSKNPYLANVGNTQIPGGYGGMSEGGSNEKTKTYVLLGMGALQLATVYWLASI